MNSKEALLNLIKVIKDPEKVSSVDDNGKLLETLEKLSEHSITQIHETLTQLDSTAIDFDSKCCLEELHNEAAAGGDNNEKLAHLIDLLQSFHIKSLLSCHDMISKQDYGLPKLSQSLSGDGNDDESLCSEDLVEESMKVVRLIKTDEPLGATIAYDGKNIVIARILRGGMADQGGLIHANDVIVEMNGESTEGRSGEEMTRMLSQYRGALTLKLIPGERKGDDDDVEEEKIFIRPRFSYDPYADEIVPCARAALSFEAGEVLRVMCKEDERWWQATKVQPRIDAHHYDDDDDDKNEKVTMKRSRRAGIIPSIRLQTRREKLKRQVEKRRLASAAAESIKGSSISLMRRERRTAWSSIKASFRRKNHGSSRNITLDTSTSSTQTGASSTSTSTKINHQAPLPPFFPPYQLVTEIPAPSSTGSYRPIVLVGPTGVGRNELKERLIDSDPVLYGVPVPHTSRSKLANERDQIDYHFVSRSFMEQGVRNKIFLEFGEYKGNLYGTSVDAVKTVARNQQICLLTPGPQALGILRNKELKPFVIFIKPPAMEKMDESDEGSKTPSSLLRPQLTLERQPANGLTMLELRDLVVRAQHMRRHYGRLFDAEVVYDQPDAAVERLERIIHAVENHSQYVPVEWT